MRLFIAEKPSVARELAACLPGPRKSNNGCIETGDGIVTWVFGHILRLAEPHEYDEKYSSWRTEDLPIVPIKWKLLVSNGCKDQFETIKRLLGEASEIIHAGDPDREGQLLVDEVLDFIGNKKPVKRILLHALDEKSIKKALADLKNNKDFLGLKLSALGRQRADWLVGMNLSRAYTLAAKNAGYETTFPVGRVKTPTLALVVRREREITAFKPVDYIDFKVDFLHDEGPFTASWDAKEDQAGLDSDGRLIDKAIADSLEKKLKGCKKKATITKFETKREKKPQPLPFSLSALQIAAGKKFGYDPQTVLDTAQALYEKKLTTYPRSDCEYLPENQFPDAANILKYLMSCGNNEVANWALKANCTIRSRTWNDEKISAHHAIIPTEVICSFDKLNDKERNIYWLVARAYIAQFYPVHEYDQSSVDISYAEENFKAYGKVVKVPGWRDIFAAEQGEGEEKAADTARDADEGYNDSLPAMKTGDKADFTSLKTLRKTTKPPERFTTSTLLAAMKNIHKYVLNPDLAKQLKTISGIGTEATRATIIKELMERKFMVEEKKKLKPSDSANILIDVLPNDLTYPDTTALWEDKLNSMVASAKTTDLEGFLTHQREFVASLCKTAGEVSMPQGKTQAEFPCPQCKTGHLRPRNGKIGKFWGCSAYPDCRATYQDKKGNPDTSEFPCPVCNTGMLKLRNGVKGKFWGCSNYSNGCKASYDDKKGKPDLALKANGNQSNGRKRA